LSDLAVSVLGAIIGFQSSAIIALGFALARTRERLVKVEQRVEDLPKPPTSSG
jgi:hypothetical protein